MRTATPETRRALKAAVSGVPYSRWARANGLRPVDVSDCLRGAAMSARRENIIRAALGLPALRYQIVELAENERVVTRSRPRATVRRAATMSREQAAQADALARRRGYRSFGAMAVAELLLEHDVEALYTGLARRNDCG